MQKENYNIFFLIKTASNYKQWILKKIQTNELMEYIASLMKSCNCTTSQGNPYQEKS